MTIRETLEGQARLYADRIALLAPDVRPLTYSGLVKQIHHIAAQLNQAGVCRGDRIAVALSDNTELAVAILAVSSVATAVFVKPTLRAEEYTTLFSRIGIKAILLTRNMPGIVREVAVAQGIPIFETASYMDEAAQLFDISLSTVSTSEMLHHTLEYAQLDDIAWLTTTSGTTDLPKIIPITHKMLYQRIGPRAIALGLTFNDRWLAFSSAGQYLTMANLLLTLYSGGSVVLPTNFDATQFFDYLEAFQPTWCTAPATLYQSILANAAYRGKSLAGTSLRFIRSGSMALPPELMREMEATFQLPIVQGYGTTEAGYVANNPLPPAPNKPGSVGVVTGLEIQILDESGQPLPMGAIGEIVLRGPGVMSGYEGNPEANRQAFYGEWFRTGDQGYLDTDGYLFLTGRINELINRGGEKIAPVQIENVLLTHPAVRQVAVFPIPDQRLGEDIAAVVVLRPEQTSTERELRGFAAEHLSATKVPLRILIVDKISTSDAGKIQRTRLAEEADLTGGTRPEQNNLATGTPISVPPQTPLELQVAALWQQVLNVSHIGIHDEFLDIGGDSLTASQLISRLRRTLDVDITLFDFFDAGTIAQQVKIIEKLLNR